MNDKEARLWATVNEFTEDRDRDVLHWRNRFNGLTLCGVSLLDGYSLHPADTRVDGEAHLDNLDGRLVCAFCDFLKPYDEELRRW